MKLAAAVGQVTRAAWNAAVANWKEGGRKRGSVRATSVKSAMEDDKEEDSLQRIRTRQEGGEGGEIDDGGGTSSAGKLLDA